MAMDSTVKVCVCLVWVYETVVFIQFLFADDMPFEISSLILSSQFWPTFKSETIELPPQLNAEFERYTKSYESYKGNRTLVWRPAIGRVELEIELGDRTVEMTVSPSQAAIISLFQEREQWTLADLSATLKLPGSVLRKRIALWQTHGIIREQSGGDVFVLVQDSSDMSSEDMMQTGSLECDEDETESAMASASEQREEDLQVFWSYIVGMLTNLDSMQLERIHQMLKMFASHGPGVEFSQEELKNFLQRKVREHKLMFAGGVYHLPK